MTKIDLGLELPEELFEQAAAGNARMAIRNVSGHLCNGKRVFPSILGGSELWKKLRQDGVPVSDQMVIRIKNESHSTSEPGQNAVPEVGMGHSLVRLVGVPDGRRQRLVAFLRFADLALVRE